MVNLFLQTTHACCFSLLLMRRCVSSADDLEYPSEQMSHSKSSNHVMVLSEFLSAFSDFSGALCTVRVRPSFGSARERLMCNMRRKKHSSLLGWKMVSGKGGG